MTELQWTVVAGATIVLLGVLVANFRDWSRAKKRITHSAAAIEEPLLASAPVERIIEGVLPSEISEAIAILEWQLPASGQASAGTAWLAACRIKAACVWLGEPARRVGPGAAPDPRSLCASGRTLVGYP
jgi:hypothetical protein